MVREVHGSELDPLKGGSLSPITGDFESNESDTYYIKRGSYVRFTPTANAWLDRLGSNNPKGLSVSGSGKESVVEGFLEEVGEYVIFGVSHGRHYSIIVNSVTGEPPVLVSDVVISGLVNPLPIGSSMTLNTVVIPDTASNKRLIWSYPPNESTAYYSIISSNASSCTIRGDAKTNYGDTGLLVRSEDGNFQKEINFQVGNGIPDTFVESIKLSGGRNPLPVGESMKVFATPFPEDATNKDISWFIRGANSTCVKISNVVNTKSEHSCIVEGVKKSEYGFVVLVAKARDQSNLGAEAEFQFKVAYDRPEVLIKTINLKALPTVLIGGSIRVETNVDPPDAFPGTVEWTMPEGGFHAEYGEFSGKYCDIIGKSEGVVTVRATAIDDGKVFEDIKISVSRYESCILYFDTQGGTPEISPKSYTGPEEIGGFHTFTVPSTIPRKDNCEFLGWSYQPGGSIQVQPGGKYKVAMGSADTLVAVYKSTIAQTITIIEGPSVVFLDSSITLIAQSYPNDIKNPAVKWTAIEGAENVEIYDFISEPGAKNACKIKGLKPGDSVIQVTADDGSNVSTTHRLHISAPVSEVRLTSEDGKEYGQQGTVKRFLAEILPDQTYDKNVTFLLKSGDAANKIILQQSSLKGPNFCDVQIGTELKENFRIEVVSTANPNIAAGMDIKVDSKPVIHGTLENPISEAVIASLDSILSDEYYIYSRTPIQFKSVSGNDVSVFASSITADDTGLNISPDGTVSGILSYIGDFKIRVDYSDSLFHNLKYSITIHSVLPKGMVSAIEVSGNSEIQPGERLTLVATSKPADAIDKRVTWEIFDGKKYIEKIAEAETETGGTFELKGISEGKSTIRVRSHDDSGAYADIVIQVALEPGPYFPPELTYKRDADRVVSYISIHHDKKTKEIILPIVSSIEDVHTANLTEISTVVFGAENRFVMDLGSSKKYNVSVKRVNPAVYDDSEKSKDHPERWSNGKWYNHLKKALDFWQNFGETPNPNKNDTEHPYLRTGGFMFHYMPPKYDEDTRGLPEEKRTPFNLFPEIHEVVFLIGSLSPRFDKQTVSFNLPLQVARMTGKSKVLENVEITYNSNLIKGDSFVRNSPKYVPIPMPMPIDSWKGENHGYAFRYWTKTRNDTDVITEQYLPGQMMLWDENQQFFAQWSIPVDAILLTTPSMGDFINVPIPQDVSYAMIYAIGGGGGAGNGAHLENLTIYSLMEYRVGGAGGSGELVVKRVGVKYGDIIRVKVGAGGAGGIYDGTYSKNKGGDGTSTVIKTEGNIITARGGLGGGYSQGMLSDSPTGLGGRFDKSGGDGAPVGTDGNDGEGNNKGKGGKKYKYKSKFGSGGAGGGAPDFDLSVSVKGIDYDLVSYGGNGGEYYDDSEGNMIYKDPTSGTYGGGGGSGKNSGAKGADGVAFILFFR